VLSHKIPLPLSVHPRQMDRALTFDKSHHLRHRVLGWNRDHHVHVIRQKMTLLDPALLLLGQLPEHLPEMRPQLRIQRLSPALRNEHDVVFALPFRVA
jgi:hypothetical protein